MTLLFQETNRVHLKNKFIVDNIKDKNLDNHTFKRVSAKERCFTRVSFKYCVFDDVYFRKSKFDSCDFTGCKFISSNLSGSSFVECNFQYCVFEKTLVDNDIINLSAPREDNLKRDFARTLRKNYQQVGDSKSVNMAIKIELEATEAHLKKSWCSKERYYREKYRGAERLKAFFSWLNFKFFDFIWGNGEKVWKLIRLMLLIILIIAFINFVEVCPEHNILNSILQAFSIFFGVTHPIRFSSILITIITIIRLLIFGMLLSLIIKRLNRR